MIAYLVTGWIPFWWGIVFCGPDAWHSWHTSRRVNTRSKTPSSYFLWAIPINLIWLVKIVFHTKHQCLRCSTYCKFTMYNYMTDAFSNFIACRKLQMTFIPDVFFSFVNQGICFSLFIFDVSVASSSTVTREAMEILLSRTMVPLIPVLLLSK